MPANLSGTGLGKVPRTLFVPTDCKVQEFVDEIDESGAGLNSQGRV